MPDDAGEFEDDADLADGYCAPLPPADRLWRHPSEIGQAGDGAGTGGVGRDRAPTTYGRALFTSPARAGSWSAGIAGALLATGLVLVGTHLAASMSPRSGSASRGGPADLIAASTTAVIAAGLKESTFAPAGAQARPLDVGRQLAKVAERIYAATVLVQATRGARTEQAAGLVVGPDCLVVAPASFVAGQQTLDLTLSDGRLVAARVVGVDMATGIAVLRCDARDVATVPDSSASASPHQMVALVYDAPHAIGLAVGLVVASDQRLSLDEGLPLLDGMSTDIPATSEGAALVDGDGEVVGVVVGSLAGTAVAAPTWLAVSVAREYARTQAPEHAWLGIDGATVTDNGQPAGVRVQLVDPASAAAKAGLREGDLIRGIDGLDTSTLVALQARLYCLQPGTHAEIDVLRGTRPIVERATLEQAPAA